MTDEFDPFAIGIIDETEPDTPDEPDADYDREAEAVEAEQPSDDSDVEATPDEEDADPETDADEESDEEPDEDTPADDEDGEAEGDGPIEFAGREWESMEAIEQSFKSWEGRITAANEKVAEYETRLSDYYEYVQNVGRENEELRKQITGETPASRELPEGDAKEVPTEVDLKKVLRVAKLAADQGIDPVEAAIKLYDHESKLVMDARLEDLEARLSAPAEEAKAQTEAANAEREMFAWAQGATDDDGQPRYPMLQKDKLDEEFVGNVYKSWQALMEQFGAKYAYSQIGLDQAYGLAERYAIVSGDFQPDTPDAKPKRDTASRRVMNADAEAASDLTGETPSLNRPKKSMAKQRLQELQDHKEVTLGGESLGFFE